MKPGAPVKGRAGRRTVVGSNGRSGAAAALLIATLAAGCKREGDVRSPVVHEEARVSANGGGTAHTGLPASAGFRLSDAPPLAEDPVAAARASAQWREHLAREERERQAAFDRHHLAEHRAILDAFRALQRRCAKSPPGAIRKDEARQQARDLAEIDRRIAAVDPWGNSSHLNATYVELRRSLSSHCDATIEPALTSARRWLEEAAEDEESD